MPYRLIYKSTATKPIDSQLLDDISKIATINNKRDNITGLLLATGESFLQILEGNFIELNELLSKIERDSRHKDLKIISYEPINSIYFDDWNLKAVGYNAFTDSIKTLLSTKYGRDKNKNLLIPEDPSIAFSLLFDVQYYLRNQKKSILYN